MSQKPLEKNQEAERSPHRSLRWKFLRGLLLLLMLTSIGMFIAGIFDFQTYAASHPEELIPYTPTWTPSIFNQILAQLGLSYAAWTHFSLVTSTINALVIWIVGFLIFFRKGTDGFGLYLGVVLVLFGSVSGSPGIAFAGSHPEFNWFFTPMGVSGWFGLFLLAFLFPNGRFVPHWTRWIAFFLLVVYGFSILILTNGGAQPPAVLLLAILATMGMGIGSQVYRFRKVSTPFERQQTKWVMAAIVVEAVILIISIIPAFLPDLLKPGSPGNRAALILSSLPNFFSSLLPLSIAFAILRYHLWDIDLIIRRTLQYGLLSLLLGLLYFGMVVLLGQLVLAITGQNSPLVVVLSTLAIAALFTPLRRRIQNFIDLSFFRRSYNTEHILAGFADLARSETDIHALTVKMVEITTETIQPESISLWIRSGAKIWARSQSERNKPV